MNTKNTVMAKRITATVFGVTLCAISVGFFKMAAYGVDPFQTFMSGLDNVIPIQFGTLYVIANAILLLFSFFADRHYIGLGTLINLFLTGYIVQFSYEFLQKIFGVPSVPAKILFLLIGIVAMCFSSAFYFTADLGVSPYDAVALILANKWHLAKFQYCRIACDLVCVIIGCLLYLLGGGKVSMLPTIAGVGTIITAFFMGPLIEFFNVKIARPLLK